MGSLDPTKAKRQEAKAKSNRVLGKLGVSSVATLVLHNCSNVVVVGQGLEINRV